MVAEIVYRSGASGRRLDPSLDPFLRLRCVRVDDVTYLMHWPDENSTLLLGVEIGGLPHPFTHIPYEDDVFTWVARQQIRDPADRVFVLIGEQHVPVQSDLLRKVDVAKIVGPVWCPVANMTAQRPYGPGGAEIKHGSKHFAAGAKLYYRSGFWGNAAEQVEVAGHHRASHRYVTMVVSSAWLENWRVELVYSPHVISELWPRWSGSARSKQDAQDVVDIMRGRVANSGSPAEGD